MNQYIDEIKKYDNTMDGTTTTMLPFIYFLHSIVHSLTDIDNLLNAINVKEYTYDTVLVIIRTFCPYRNNLKCHKDICVRLVTHLNEQGIDSKKLLYGLRQEYNLSEVV